nr:MAG: DNA pilot protein [Microvirus sp.]
MSFFVPMAAAGGSGLSSLGLSSIISAGSNILGGLLGSKKKRGPSWDDQLTMHRQGIFTDMKAKMDAARENNIHPIVALGGSFQGPQAQAQFGDSGGTDWGSVLDTAGQGVSRAVAAAASREEREIAKVSAKLSLENQELQNARLRSEIALMHQAGTPPSYSYTAPETKDARYPGQSHMPLGFGDTAPLLRMARAPNGSMVRVYNDDLGDNELLQAASAFGYSMPDFIHGNFTRPAAKKLRGYLENMIDWQMQLLGY